MSMSEQAYKESVESGVQPIFSSVGLGIVKKVIDYRLITTEYIFEDGSTLFWAEGDWSWI